MQEERKSLLSVRDVATAIVHLGIMEALYPFLVIGYVIIKGGYTPLETLLLILKHFPTGMQVAIGLIIFKEAIDIMLFRRWNEAKAAFAAGVEQAKAEGKAEGRAEGRAEGKAEGIAERDRQWAAWNQRRAEAEARGEPFHEPPPHA